MAHGMVGCSTLFIFRIVVRLSQAILIELGKTIWENAVAFTQ